MTFYILNYQMGGRQCPYLILAELGPPGQRLNFFHHLLKFKMIKLDILLIFYDESILPINIAFDASMM
jgi:hypothetical protein